MAGNVGVGLDGFRAIERLQPLGRIGRSHRGEDAVQKGFAEEQNLPAREAHAEVAARVRAAEEQHVDAFGAEFQRLALGHEDRVRGQFPTALAAAAGARGFRAIENRLRRRVDDVGDAGGEGGVAGRVVAVIRADHDVFDRLCRDFRDRIHEASRLGDAALTVRHEHALVCDDEHVGGGEFLVPRVKVLVGVDVLGDFDRARKVAEFESSLDRVGGADHRLR